MIIWDMGLETRYTEVLIREITGTISDSGLPVYHRTCSFIDSTKGWIGGTGGSIYNTTDGGGSYNDQTFGTKQNINGICFSDSINRLCLRQ